jgi:Zn-finger nucleic acid-binding protein
MYCPQGIVVDSCPECRGLWLDEGEISALVKNSDEWALKLNGPLLDKKISGRSCSRCQCAFAEGGLYFPDVVVERCPKCRGLWFDAEELEAFVNHFESAKGLRQGKKILPSKPILTL